MRNLYHIRRRPGAGLAMNGVLSHSHTPTNTIFSLDTQLSHILLSITGLWSVWLSQGWQLLKAISHMQKFICFLSVKVGLSPSKKKFIICFNDSPSKMMKNAFYFILKALFVLKIFKFLSWVFAHVEKTAWLERSG